MTHLVMGGWVGRWVGKLFTYLADLLPVVLVVPIEIGQSHALLGPNVGVVQVYGEVGGWVVELSMYTQEGGGGQGGLNEVLWVLYEWVGGWTYRCST